jgi:hypothetical protein
MRGGESNRAFCRCEKKNGKVIEAISVGLIVPHEGDYFVALCARYNNIATYFVMSPAVLRVTSISTRAARAIRPLSFASVTKRKPIAIMRAA